MNQRNQQFRFEFIPGYAFEYVNYKETYRKKTNEELFEGWMRSDFSNKTIRSVTYDSIRVVKL